MSQVETRDRLFKVETRERLVKVEQKDRLVKVEPRDRLVKVEPRDQLVKVESWRAEVEPRELEGTSGGGRTRKSQAGWDRWRRNTFKVDFRVGFRVETNSWEDSSMSADSGTEMASASS